MYRVHNYEKTGDFESPVFFMSIFAGNLNDENQPENSP